ncbi:MULTISPECIES: catalase [Chryseobacterium]|uniref:Catalase n=2 Tax=Chryseobacterium TaxID=59732 RepID=A0A3M7TI88_9FLAO|nr:MULTISPECIES: catalase [Chryseobacterium]RNA61920.1 catalase [Chryseobacterium nematophagum]CAA7386263.1 Catalase [Chryseobacterium fistulae]
MKKNCIILGLFITSILQAQQLTTNTGTPVGDNQNSKTVGNNGPVLLEDIHLIEKLAAFDRERIPERVVHARGAGAMGEFVADADFSEVTSADFLSKAGKKTPVTVRFSMVVHQQGSPETYRDPRGFAVKFYTEQGNYDLVGNNLPVFFIRDAIKFPDMVHAFKPSPVTNGASDANRVFDFFANVPEGTHMLTWLFSDYGIPANYREMNGNGVHAFKWVNDKGEVTYVKYKWISRQGERNLTQEEADKIQSTQIEHATLDLYKAIQDKNFPKWDLYVQMLKKEDFDALDFNPVDVTKIWPESIAKSVKVGTMTLNQNPANYFQEVEQAAFSPGSLVPGIEPSEDKLLQGRLFSYFDTQRHRLGGNFQQIPVNAAKNNVLTYNQNGYMSVRPQTGDVNYQPSASKPQVVDNKKFKYSQTVLPSGTTITQGKIDKENNFKQAGELYRSFSKKDQDNLIKNLGNTLNSVRDKKTVAKMISYFYQADADYGKRLAAFVKMDRNELESLINAK